MFQGFVALRSILFSIGRSRQRESYVGFRKSCASLLKAHRSLTLPADVNAQTMETKTLNGKLVIQFEKQKGSNLDPKPLA